MDEHKIIGIDPGLKSTGYGIVTVKDKKIFYMASGTIITNPRDDESARLKDIFQGISEIVSKFQPTQAVVEKIFVNINASSTIALGQARGVAIAALAHHQMDIHELTPLEIKKSIVGTGKANKKQVQFMIKELLKIQQSPGADASDALACTIAWHNKLKLQ
ncbi:MAG: crossover junction endodeoxyribonuclease RuvC [Burkholderiaceae bacterium]|tara:strand:- start:191 stop:673 length:483 start_codon:yes stop_codon:yes gene_type:complete